MWAMIPVGKDDSITDGSTLTCGWWVVGRPRCVEGGQCMDGGHCKAICSCMRVHVDDDSLKWKYQWGMLFHPVFPPVLFPPDFRIRVHACMGKAIWKRLSMEL